MDGTQAMSGSRSWAELNGFKVHFTQRNHHPQAMPREDNIHGGVVIGGSTGLTSSIVVGEGSKRHFGDRYSTDERRPEGKRYLAPPLPKDYENRGKKLISVLEYCDKEITLPTKKKFKESGMKNSASEVTLPSATWTRKRTVMVDEHTPAAMKQSDIFLLEASMNRKQRVANILAQRNMIPSASSGDLPFKQADREPGFYAKGGLIPGSTNILRQSAKPTLRKSEELANSSGKKLEATYGAMKARLEKDYDQRQVLSLTVRLVLLIRSLKYHIELLFNFFF